MAGHSAWIGSALSVNFTTASTSRYGHFGNNAVVNSTSGEAFAQSPSPAGVYSKLACHVTANARVTDTTLRIRINGANGNQTVTIPAGTTGHFRDNSNTDNVAAGDLVCWVVVTGTGTQTLTVADISVVFTDATTDTIAMLFRNSVSNAGLSAGNRGWGFGHGNTSSIALPVAQAQNYAPAAGNMIRLHTYVSANTAVGNTTHTLRINGVDSASVNTIAAGVTGLSQDTSNTPAIAQDQGFYLVSNSSNTTNRSGVWFRATSSLFTMAALYPVGTGVPASGTTVYLPPFGGINGATSATEANVQARAPFPMTLKKIRVYYQVNNSTTAITFTVRINGVNTALTVTVPGTGTKTGLFTFSTNVSVAVDDLISIVASGSNNSLDLTHVSIDADSSTAESLPVGSGLLELLGNAPTFKEAISVGSGLLALTGNPPLFETPLVSQLAIYAAVELAVDARVSQAAIYAVVEHEVQPRLSQAVAYVVADVEPCETRRATCWIITRRDGRVLTFTSHDNDLPWRGRIFKACDSLDPSASENSSALGSVSNTEMAGIISHDDITEADLYGGLYDDAFVEVWLVPWEAGSVDTPKRLQAGWMGNISQGEVYFKAEVLGAGQRIGQQTLTEPITPLCRVHLGSAECGFNIEALKVEGHVLATFRRDLLSADVSPGSAPAQWENGFVRFTSGVNDGYEVEVRSVDFDTGEIVLMIGSPYLSSYGDTFDLYPGCDKIKSGGCTVYDNVLNHRGFDDIPGVDSMLETPDSKI